MQLRKKERKKERVVTALFLSDRARTRVNTISRMLLFCMTTFELKLITNLNIVTGGLAVVYFEQLLGAAHTQKLAEILFQPFSTFFVHFKSFSVISCLKSTKKSEN